MRRWATKATALSASVVLLAGTAAPAAADGLHLIENNPAFVWAGGCTMTYSMDAGTQQDYGSIIPTALQYITAYTGVTFTPVQGPAAIAMSIDPSLGGGNGDGAAGGSVYGLGAPTSDGSGGWLKLAPAAKYTDMPNAQYEKSLKQNLVIHEVLHVMGLGHDNDAGTPPADEMMNEILPVGQTKFGNGDLTGMQYIADRNGCTPQGNPPTSVTPDKAPTSDVAGPAFATKTVRAFVPLKAIYLPGKFKTIVGKYKVLKVPAKSNGVAVQVRFTDGKWRKVPYRYRPASNTLVYEEAQRLYLGLPNDPLGGVIPTRVNG